MSNRALAGIAIFHGGAWLTCLLMTALAATPTLAVESKLRSAVPVPQQQCPSAEFGEFLRGFASSQAAALRRQYTRDPLEYETPAGVVEERGAARLERFNYRYLPQFDLYVPEDVATNPVSLDGMRRGVFNAPVSVEAQPSGSYRVTFGMEYESDSYVFQRHDGCWELLRAINLRD